MSKNNNYWQCSNTFMVLTFLTLAIITESSFTENRLPLWTWECVNDKCVPSKPLADGKLQSLITCNMLCASMQLWPQPTGPVSLSSTAVPVRSDFFELQILSSPSRAVFEHLSQAFYLMQEELKKLEPKVPGFEEWRSATVRVLVNGTLDPRMRVGTDESYRLSITPVSDTDHQLIVDISAKSFCGARHAFETLAQLVWIDPYVGSLMILDAAIVEDAPRFGYRGLMLDTARNFFPISELLRTVDAMGANKLNTLHWHVSDSQAFPLQLPFAPQLAAFGAHGARAVYSEDDVRAVVRRARLRGIRVLLEVDTPAHVGRAWSWGPQFGLGNLSHCFDAEPWTQYCAEPPCGQLNSQNNHSYRVLEQIYGEIIHLTGVDDLFHIGGDDVSEHCWKKQITDSCKTNAILWVQFTRTALQRLKLVNNNRMPNLTMMWMSHLSERIKSDLKEFVPYLGLQSRGTGWSQKAVSGLRTVLSNEDAWDFNDGLGAWYESSDGAPYNNWQRVYEHRPRSGGRVVGGEGTVWSGRLGPELSARVWPRAAALAERLWADSAEGATRAVHARLDVHRARMMARGHLSAPVWSMWCSHNPYTCL